LFSGRRDRTALPALQILDMKLASRPVRVFEERGGLGVLLEIPDLLQLLLVLLSVVRLAVVFERPLCLAAVLHAVVQVVEDGLERVLESAGPVDSTTSGGGGAGSVHPVHTIGADQWVQRLGGLLDGLVECFGRAVAALTEHLVLGEEHAVDTAHQAASLAVQVGPDFLLEGGLVEVATANGDTHCNSLLFCLASDVLVDGNGGVDTSAFTEEGADSSA